MTSSGINIKGLLTYAGTTLVLFFMAFFLFSFTEDKKIADEAALAKAALQQKYVWFEITNPGSGCDEINPDQHEGDEAPTTAQPAANPLGCNAGPICCARGYLPQDVEYNAAEDRWEPKEDAEFVTRGKTL